MITHFNESIQAPFNTCMLKPLIDLFEGLVFKNLKHTSAMLPFNSSTQRVKLNCQHDGLVFTQLQIIVLTLLYCVMCALFLAV